MNHLTEILDQFPDQAVGLAHLEAMIWPKDPVRPKCGVVNDALRLSRPGVWYYRVCRTPFNARRGTPRQGMHLLRTWFAAFPTAAFCKGTSGGMHREMCKLFARTLTCDCGNVKGRNRSAAATTRWYRQERENRAGHRPTRVELGNRRRASVSVVEARIVTSDKR
jgi:hypothetical protein